jgi:hypothetical protein
MRSFFAARSCRLSGFLVQRIRQGLTPARRCQSHSSGVQMHRRLSAIFAALALAQFSLGGAAAFCPSHRPSSHDTQAQGEHSPAGIRCHTGDSRANVNVPTHSDAPSCDPSAQGDCVGMTSCAAVIASARSEDFAAGLRPDQTRPRVLDLIPGPNLSPEPPPPRS